MKAAKSIIAFIIIAISGLTQAAPPANDSLLKATRLPGIYASLPGQNLDLATADPMDPLSNGASAGKSLWYCVPVPAMSGKLQVTIKSTTASGMAALFNVNDPENPRGSLGPVQNQSAALTPGAAVTLTWWPSKPVMVMVAGTGQFDLIYHFSDTFAANDLPATAIALTGERGTIYGDNSTATLSPDEPTFPAANPKPPGIINTLWYVWTPAFTDLAALDTNFSFSSGDPFYDDSSAGKIHDTVIGVFKATSGASPEALEFVGVDDDSGWTRNSRFAFNAVAGTTYYIQVGTFKGTAVPGSFHLQYYRCSNAGELYIGSYGAPVLESAASASVVVRRRYAGFGNASCTLANTAAGSATAGADYAPFAKTISFMTLAPDVDEVWEAETTITIKEDPTPENGETVTMQLSAPSLGVTLGNASSYVYINDNDTVQSPGFTMPVNTIRVAESSATGYVTIKRTGDASVELPLFQTLSGASATPGTDFTLYSLSGMQPGQTETFSSFYIKNDNVFEGEESFSVEVANQKLYTVIIEDDDPYVPVAGKLTAGLDYAAGSRQAVLMATISKLGVVTGKLTIVGQTLPFTGHLDLRGKMVALITPKTRAPFYLTLSAQNSEGAFKLELLDTATQMQSTASTVAYAFSLAHPCPLAGAINLTGSGAGDIWVSTVATVKVTASGAATVSGRLFDGSTYTAAGYVDDTGAIAAMTLICSGQGCVGIKGQLPTLPDQFSSPEVRINRPARANDPLKIGTYQSLVSGTACRYTPPAAGQYALEAWNTGMGSAVLDHGPLMNSLTKILAISTKNVITAPLDSEKLKLTVVPATGLIAGSFIPPGKTKPLPIIGVLCDLSGVNGYGRGFFFDGLKGGRIIVGKP